MTLSEHYLHTPLLRHVPLQQSESRMHMAPGAPASQALPEPLPEPALPERQTLFPVSQLSLQQSEFRLQRSPGLPQPASDPPRPVLAPVLAPEEGIVHVVVFDT